MSNSFGYTEEGEEAGIISILKDEMNPWQRYWNTSGQLRELEPKPSYRGGGKIWRLDAWGGELGGSIPELGAPSLGQHTPWLSYGDAPTLGEE